MNITEDYVSFEVAKLLREKGFEQDYYSYPVYWMNGNKPTLSFEGDDDFPYSQNECVAPSFSTVMKWLREVHNIFIQVDYIWSPKELYTYTFDIHNMKNARSIFSTPYGESFDSYEETCEAAIKYCLNNLI